MGQEVLTQDKVSLRINLVCNYRVTDYVKILTEIDDYAEQMHIAVQLALRAYVGAHKLDESPMAYKSMVEIVEQIEPTAEIVCRIKPLYNFKATE